MVDERTYGTVATLRIINSLDELRADRVKLPSEIRGKT